LKSTNHSLVLKLKHAFISIDYKQIRNYLKAILNKQWTKFHSKFLPLIQLPPLSSDDKLVLFNSEMPEHKGLIALPDNCKEP
jgi:hypothetical protein